MTKWEIEDAIIVARLSGLEYIPLKSSNANAIYRYNIPRRTVEVLFHATSRNYTDSVWKVEEFELGNL